MKATYIAALLTVVVFTFFALGENYAQAAQLHAEDCKAARWPHSQSLHGKALAKILRGETRASVLQYYVAELTDPKSTRLERELGEFLENTEPNELLQGYFQVLARSTDPEDGSKKPRALPLTEVCSHFKATLESKPADESKSSPKNSAEEK